MKISQGFDFSRGRTTQRIKRRLKGIGRGKIARTQAHLNGRYTLRWRTCTCVLRLHSFARSLGSSVYLAAKHTHIYTHWPIRYVLAPSEIVSGCSRQTLDRPLSLPFRRSTVFSEIHFFLNFKLISCFPVVFHPYVPLFALSCYLRRKFISYDLP